MLYPASTIPTTRGGIMNILQSLIMGAFLALPVAVQAQGFVNMEQGPSTALTKATVLLVDASGNATKVEPMAVQPKGGTKFFAYTWKYVLPGAEAETVVAGPVKIVLGKVAVREVTSGYHLVKVRREGGSRRWEMKQNSESFYPASESQVFKPEEAPAPKKGEDGA